MAGNPRPEPQAIVVFGASGDLARRKVLPALYDLAREGALPERYAVVGYARTPMPDDGFRAHARQAVEEHSRTPLEEEHWKPFAEALTYVSGPFDAPGCFAELRARLSDLDDEHGLDGRRLYYCATPPSAFPPIVARLGECGPQDRARIVIEKPFGRDLASARELSSVAHEVFDESRIFRIDHYLGKETVQNIIVLRFANSMFERVWNRDAIDHVQITVAEAVGMAGRGPSYEEAGAIRDMIQSHLLQLLAFIAMEPPRSLEPEAVRDEKVKVLRALLPFDRGHLVRGQYGPGTSNEEEVPGYRREKGVSTGSRVETFAAVRARIDNWRWAGVPFFLRTGKRMAKRATQIAVVFREPPAYIFEAMEVAAPPPNHLVVDVQPHEGVSFAFQAKQPGRGFTPRTVRMDFSYDEYFKAEPPEAYERLLLDAMIGDHTLFTREDEVERAWQLVEPVLDLDVEPAHYAAGTWGPMEAADLVAPRAWHRP